MTIEAIFTATSAETVSYAARSGDAGNASGEFESVSRYSSVSILLDISDDAKTSKPLQDLEKAIDTLKQSAAQAKAFEKGAAGQKLALAVKELTLLKLLGTGLNGVKEAVRIAKQIAGAVADYSAASSDSGGTTLPSTDPADATATPAAAATGAASATEDTTTPVPADPTTTAAAALTQSDPFYTVAEAALAVLAKYLREALPALKASPDKHDREAAGRLEKEFDRSVDSTLADAQAAGASAPPVGVNFYA